MFKITHLYKGDMTAIYIGPTQFPLRSLQSLYLSWGHNFVFVEGQDNEEIQVLVLTLGLVLVEKGLKWG